MLYVARNRDLGVIYVSEIFKNVFKSSLLEAKGELYPARPGTQLIKLTKCDAIIDVELPGHVYPVVEYINEVDIGYVAVSSNGYVVDINSGLYEFNKGE